MDNIKLSVRELVEFVYKSGDLNVKALKADRAMEGIKAHKILQSNMGSLYQKEFYLKHEFVYKNINFVIEGRADGLLIEDERVTIDEIKSTYSNLDDIDKDYNLAHIAQAKCYAYIYSIQNNIENINIQLRYYNIDSQKTKVITYFFSAPDLEFFFNQLLEKYIDWAETIINIRKCRSETINELTFPFKMYRLGQRDFSVAVFKTIQDGKKLFAQAPTGVGKTISVLFPAIKAMNYNNNSKIFYLTAKSSTKNIAFKTIEMMVKKGLNLRTVVITAKEKICFKDECICDPEYCEYAKGYYEKVNFLIKNSLKFECLYDRDYIEQAAKKNEICPFEFSLDLSYVSDVVICDYNYYFDPRVSLQREDLLKNNNDILLIDEAHNLEDRARNMYSPEIIKEEFYEGYKLLKNIDKKVSKELNNINKKFIEIKKKLNETTQILDTEPSELINALRKFVIAGEEFINENNDKDIVKEITDLYFKSTFFIKIAEIVDGNFCFYAESSKGKTLVRIFLIDPSKILHDIEKRTLAAIFFSATLTPLKYYRYLLGGDDKDYVLKLKSPFDSDNLNLLITSDISMKYSLRDLNIKRVCEYINTIISERKGNYMVFFPSYSFLDKVYNLYKEIYQTNNIILQYQNINEEKQNEIVNMFNESNGNILFTVVGGVFSEGIDLPLEKLVGAVIIGTGIPQISFERDIIKDFFESKFNEGFNFAYKYPGFNKILQSAGRVIRTENDIGIVLLIDSRLCQQSYIRLFPEHWNHYKRVYKPEAMKKEIKKFWNEKV